MMRIWMFSFIVFNLASFRQSMMQKKKKNLTYRITAWICAHDWAKRGEIGEALCALAIVVVVQSLQVLLLRVDEIHEWANNARSRVQQLTGRSCQALGDYVQAPLLNEVFDDLLVGKQGRKEPEERLRQTLYFAQVVVARLHEFDGRDCDWLEQKENAIAWCLNVFDIQVDGIRAVADYHGECTTLT